MSESTQKSVYGLIGYPLGHSLSPLMHNAAFTALGVDAVYKLFPLREEELDNFFANLKEKNSNIFGLNVTVPYKEKVLKYLNSLSPFAQKIGAVNTIVINPDRSLIGHNTDGPGFLTHLTELGFEPRNKKVAILGAGGAARAIISVLSLIPGRPASIKVYDIDTQKAHNLVDDLKNRLAIDHICVVHSIDDLEIDKSNLLINATPVGLKEDDPCLVDEGLLHEGLFVYDLIYNPSKTRLLQLAERCGCQTANGLDMLFYQGVLAFQHWADCELSEEIKGIMRKSLLEGLKQ